MAKILRILSTTKKYGGDLYEEEMQQALASQHSVELFNPVPTESTSRIQKLPAYIQNLHHIGDKKNYDYVIRALNHVFFMQQEPKQIVIAYHYDTAFCHPLVKMHHYLTLKSLLFAKDKTFRLVVIAQYWADFFQQLGFKNIENIYCGFKKEEFQVSDEEVQKFLQKHQLEGKKLLYIGNSQKKKGAPQVYEALKDSDYFMVTSGNKDVELPLLNLSLNFKDYLCLLKASGAVVTFSQFKEGWNRVAHEAMMLGTPVIGSGLGGMGELLQGGGQIVCSDPRELKKQIDHIYANKDLGLQGKAFAETFTMERFNQSWRGLVR